MFLPFFPLFSFLAVALRSGRISAAGAVNLSKWVVKFVLLEPLRLLELILFDARIRRHRIAEDPIFVLGHFRSGTTYLHQLLARDPRLGNLNVYQMLFPEIFLSTERFLKPLLARIVTALRIRDEFHEQVANLENAAEEDVAIVTMGLPEGAYWGLLFPHEQERYWSRYAWFDAGDTADLAAWEARYLYVLKKISLANGGRRLALKSPANTARVRQLLKIFPRARFVYLQRSPYDVRGSCRKFWDITRKNGFQTLSSAEEEEITYRIYERMLAAYLAQRALIPEGQLVEVRFEDLAAAPLEQLERIYRSLGMEGFAEAKAGFAEAVAGMAGRPPRHYAMGAQEIAEIRARWSFSLAEWPYPDPPQAP